MRVLVAPDSFGGTLSAAEAATAIASGWRRGAPGDSVETLPLSDGGPGFVEVLSGALGGDTVSARVRDPLGRRVSGTVLLVDGVAYVESAQACGLHLLEPAARDPLTTSTYGVGELIEVALDAGATRIVVGLGGSGTNDGGRGMLEALGLRQHTDGRVDRSGLDRRLAGTVLVAATDVDNPLLGPSGASAVFGPQKGAAPDTIVVLEDRMRQWSQRLDPAMAERPGAGAAGGLGYALFVLGATRASGVELVAAAVGLSERLRLADLAVTGEGSFDGQSLHGKVCAGVAAAAQQVGVPCVVLAGQVQVDPGVARSAGVRDAFAVADEMGSLRAALEHPADGLARLAERVARDCATME